MPQRQHNPEEVSLCSRPPSRSSSNEQGLEKLELSQHPQLTDKRGWLSTLLIQLACFLWLLPIAALLTLNFKNYVVGASAWCPNRDCYVGWFNPVISVPLQNLRSFDKRDHNLLGALQFVSKALEIWFSLIAGALVYLITFLIAGKRDGLPVGYLTRTSGFANLPGLFDPLLWKTLPSATRRRVHAERKSYRLRIYLFVSFTVLLCSISNLMGPATAVLILPSLQWVTTPLVGDYRFAALDSGNPPSKGSSGPFSRTDCTDADINNLNFSCTAQSFASNFDSWIESYLASGHYGVGQQDDVTFIINQTFSASSPNVRSQNYSDLTWWTPSRQVLSSLNYDAAMVSLVSRGYGAEDIDYPNTTDASNNWNTYTAYNSSIQTIIQRTGPTIGTIVQYNFDVNDNSALTTIIDENRQVRCYKTMILPFLHWPSTYPRELTQNAYEWETVGDYTTDATAPDVNVEIFTSDKAQFFKDNVLPTWLPADCIKNGLVDSSLSCDWEKVFSEQLEPGLLNRTQNVVTIEMSQRNEYMGRPIIFTLTVDFVAFLNFTTYTLDPSPLSNPMALVQTLDLPKTGDVIKIDPLWVLAAWSVDNNGTLSPDRTAAIKMVQTMAGMVKLEPDAIATNDYMCLLPVIETLSLIDFTTESYPESDLASSNADGKHPCLTRNAKLYVWAYGLGSRTSKLGVVVVLLGVVVVLAQLVLGFIDRRRYRSPTQLLVAALEHTPSNEFTNVEHDEAKVAKMRFHVQGTMTNAGKYVFKKMGSRS